MWSPVLWSKPKRHHANRLKVLKLPAMMLPNLISVLACEHLLLHDFVCEVFQGNWLSRCREISVFNEKLTDSIQTDVWWPWKLNSRQFKKAQETQHMQMDKNPHQFENKYMANKKKTCCKYSKDNQRLTTHIKSLLLIEFVAGLNNFHIRLFWQLHSLTEMTVNCKLKRGNWELDYPCELCFNTVAAAAWWCPMAQHTNAPSPEEEEREGETGGGGGLEQRYHWPSSSLIPGAVRFLWTHHSYRMRSDWVSALDAAQIACLPGFDFTPSSSKAARRNSSPPSFLLDLGADTSLSSGGIFLWQHRLARGKCS